MPGKGRPFKKGNKFGKGRPPLPKEIRKAKALAKGQLEQRMIEMLAMDRATIKQVMQDPNAQMIDLVLGAIITKAVQKADQFRIGFILDRLLGKVPNVVDFDIPESGSGGTLVGVAYVPRSKRDQ